jgi:hypothetical protein
MSPWFQNLVCGTAFCAGGAALQPRAVHPPAWAYRARWEARDRRTAAHAGGAGKPIHCTGWWWWVGRGLGGVGGPVLLRSGSVCCALSCPVPAVPQCLSACSASACAHSSQVSPSRPARACCALASCAIHTWRAWLMGGSFPASPQPRSQGSLAHCHASLFTAWLKGSSFPARPPAALYAPAQGAAPGGGPGSCHHARRRVGGRSGGGAGGAHDCRDG